MSLKIIFNKNKEISEFLKAIDGVLVHGCYQTDVDSDRWLCAGMRSTFLEINADDTHVTVIVYGTNWSLMMKVGYGTLVHHNILISRLQEEIDTNCEMHDSNLELDDSTIESMRKYAYVMNNWLRLHELNKSSNNANSIDAEQY